MASIETRRRSTSKPPRLDKCSLSAAFDVINRGLLFDRMKTMGLPTDVIDLIENWLMERMFYVEANGEVSSLQRDDLGTIPGSLLGPVLFIQRHLVFLQWTQPTLELVLIKQEQLVFLH